MRRRLAADAEIVRRLHQRQAEDLLPVAIDRDACRERVLGGQQPSRQIETRGPRVGLVFLQRREGGRDVGLDATLSDALFQITAKRLGMTAVVDADGKVAGIFTDGDLRRVLARDGDFRTLPITEVMTRDPRTIAPDHLAVEAVELMERHRINQMLVVDADGALIGALNMHDLFSKKVI